MNHNTHVRQAMEQERQRNTPGGTSGFYGRLTGKTYESLEAMRHHERLEAMRRNVPTDEEAAFEALPAEKVREHIERAMQSEKEKTELFMSSIDLQTFFELHPEYKDCQENSSPMVSFLRAKGIPRPTLSDLEDAYNNLRAAGLLQLNRAAIQKQQKAEIQQRARGIEDQRTLPDEDELYSMPLEEIRRRATPGGWYR